MVSKIYEPRALHIFRKEYITHDLHSILDLWVQVLDLWNGLSPKIESVNGSYMPSYACSSIDESPSLLRIRWGYR